MKLGRLGLALVTGLACVLTACGSSAHTPGGSGQPVQFSGTLTGGQRQVAKVSLHAGDALRWWAKLPDDAKLTDSLQFTRFNLAVVGQTGIPQADTSRGRGTVRFSDTAPVFFDFDHSNQWHDGNQALAGVWMTYVAPATATYTLRISLVSDDGTLDTKQVPYTGAYSTNPSARKAGSQGFSPARWRADVAAQLNFLYGQSNFWPLNGFSFYESAGSAGCGDPCTPPPPPPAPKPNDVGPQAHAHKARQAVVG